MFELSGLLLSAEFQPLLNPHTKGIYGYEALSRFYYPDGTAIAPNIVFEELHAHHELLNSVEMAAKYFQLEHAPNDGVLFVNIDPHAIEFNSTEMLSLLRQRDNVCVEIIENTCINDAHLAANFIKQLVKIDIPVGLDDVGAPHSMLSIDLMSQVSCLKFDKYWLETAKNPQYHHLISALISFAKKTNKLTVLEGVETEEQLIFARELGVDLVQGFLFKPQFINAKQRVLLSPMLAQVS
ncbi:EAL domain-containing protein [Shewanella sp. KX20019]|uniref:EAL domain-containing protein n=1 Tax=Shewanella sp. KX20019 TaxID=2803864 RepID=UPI001927A7C9|nr:EAL domain-containing protein [Shewanella sp. KX20019]QQX82226.1 EAL domain-containing protein [Shewanella sp. KX20019]